MSKTSDPQISSKSPRGDRDRARNPKKAGGKLDDSKSIVATAVFQPRESAAINRIKLQQALRSAITEEVEEKYSPKGRKLRKAFERPRPDLRSDAPVNRTRRPVSLSLPPDLLEQLNKATKDKGLDRGAFIERAIRLALNLS